MTKTVKPSNIICHICIKNKKKKIQTFQNTKNLNIHLKIQHNVPYKIYFVKGSTIAISRTNS